MSDDTTVRIDELPSLAGNPSLSALTYIFQSGILQNIEIGNLGFARWYTGGAAPTGVRSSNDFWIDTGNGNTIRRWNGSVWASLGLSYNSLTNRPVLGSASSMDASAFATAAQGLKADTALQPGDVSPSPDNLIVVNSLADLPSLSSGSYNLAGNTTYLIAAPINIGTNRLTMASGTKIIGLSPYISVITYTGTSIAINGSDANVLLSSFAVIGSGSGTMFSADNTDQTKSFYIDGVHTSGFATFAYVDKAVDISISNCNITMASVGQPLINIEGDVGYLSVQNNVTNGAFILTGATAEIESLTAIGNCSLSYNDNNITITETALFIGNHILQLLNVTAGTPHYQFSSNGGVQDTLYSAVYGFSGNSSATTISTQNDWVKLEITTTAHSLNRFEHTNPNELEYIGIIPRDMRILVSARLETGSNNVTYELGVFKNDVLVSDAVDVIDCRNMNILENSIINSYISFNPEDVIDIRIRNTTGTENVTVESLSVTVGA